MSSKPLGLDWDAIRPRCTRCGVQSGLLNNLDLCPACDPSPRPVIPDDPSAPAPVRRRVGPTPKRRQGTPGVDRRRIPPEREADIIGRYKAGESMETIQTAIGTTTRTIRRVLLDAGVEIRPAHRLPRKAAGS